MSRILIFTGKGGVGKTSVAAAHARLSALEGQKTLIVSTDMAHNLSDIFQVVIGKKPVTIDQNLDALEIDPNYMMEHEFSDMKRALLNLISSSGMPVAELSQISIFPGMDELFSLLKILEIYESGVYDRMIIDCAPTGETLALLKFPELLSWYMEKFLPVGKVALRVLSPLSKAIYKIELPDKAAVSDIERLFLKLVALQELLKNRAVTSVRIVAMPEKMVLEETKRNYMYMNLFNYHVDGLYINRILPKDIGNAFFDEWIELQEQYIEAYEMTFGEVPIYKIPWFDTDINGFDGIDRIVNQTLKGKAVFEVIPEVASETYIKTEQGYEMKLFLPCLEKSGLDLHETGTDIIVRIGNFKRSIPKPNVLRAYEIQRANLEKQVLTLFLTEKAQ